MRISAFSSNLRRNVISADDYEIDNLGIYANLAEYHHDLCKKEVYFRPLDGWWPESLKHAGEFKLLSQKDVADCRVE